MSSPISIPAAGAQAAAASSGSRSDPTIIPSPSQSLLAASLAKSPGSIFNGLEAVPQHTPQTGARLKPFNTAAIKILMLENLAQTGVELFNQAGYQIEFHQKALDPEVLKEKIKDFHAIGIRSKTQLTPDILKHAKKLLVIGCFCIGTNQVDLDYTASQGIAVFNSPFSNSRSVAELVIAYMISLARSTGDFNIEMHKGVWNKTKKDSHEVRGKTLGIVGYGHIGSQLSVLADSLGMQVVFYDVQQVMPLGIAKPLASLEELLKTADFVTLHVPELPETRNMISEPQLKLMKPGSFLVNASRGTVVDIPALKKALDSGHIAGAAVDVYPVEPAENGPGWKTELAECANVVLTPHIGGSTEEAQNAIGAEVASNMIKYINNGCSLGAVNFPQIDIRNPAVGSKSVRILNIHHNVPGVLKQINRLLSDFNIDKQICDSSEKISYLMADVSATSEEDIKAMYQSISSIPENILTRVLY